MHVDNQFCFIGMGLGAFEAMDVPAMAMNTSMDELVIVALNVIAKHLRKEHGNEM